MLLRKQGSYNERFQTKMMFDPRKSGYEAGLVLWWNQFSYSTIGLSNLGDQQGSPQVVIACRSPTGRVGEMTVGTLTPNSVNMS
jgi:hypothetical protein